MFMENSKYGPGEFQLELYFTTPENHDVKVHITSPKWNFTKVNETITVKPGIVQSFKISNDFRMIGSSISSKSILIESDGDLAVYGGNKESYSNDVYCALPNDVLGTEYYAMCYSPAMRKTEFGVAAVEDATSVTITLPTQYPEVTVNYAEKMYTAGDTFVVKLNSYETLQIQSSGDLTGSHVVSDKPIAMISGNIKTNIGQGTPADHLVEQMTPVVTWGKKFVTAPTPSRTTGDVFRLVASEDNTTVDIVGQGQIHMHRAATGPEQIHIPKAGDWVEIHIPSDAFRYVTSIFVLLVIVL